MQLKQYTKFYKNVVDQFDLKHGVVWLLLFSLLLLLQYRLWLGSNSVATLNKVNERITIEQKISAKLLHRNKKLAKEIVALQNGTELLEEYAREELGMIKPGETFYLITD